MQLGNWGLEKDNIKAKGRKTSRKHWEQASLLPAEVQRGGCSFVDTHSAEEAAGHLCFKKGSAGFCGKMASGDRQFLHHRDKCKTIMVTGPTQSMTEYNRGFGDEERLSWEKALWADIGRWVGGNHKKKGEEVRGGEKEHIQRSGHGRRWATFQTLKWPLCSNGGGWCRWTWWFQINRGQVQTSYLGPQGSLGQFLLYLSRLHPSGLS